MQLGCAHFVVSPLENALITCDRACCALTATWGCDPSVCLRGENNDFSFLYPFRLS